MLSTTTLNQISSSHSLAPKWLIAPSLRVGHQWLEAAILQGHSLVNYRVLTVQSLAMELAADQIARSGRLILDPLLGAMLVGQIWDQLQPRYLGTLQRSASLERALFASIQALRLADVAADSLNPQSFEIEQKGAEIGQFYRGYCQALSDRQLLDTAEVLRMAAACLKQSNHLLAGALVLVPDELRLRGLERTLIDNIPASQCLRIPSPLDQGPAASNLQAFAKSLRGDQSTSAELRDGSLHLFRAVGAVNEVREVLRRCLAGQHSFDRVEILHTDTQTYVPLIYELSERLDPLNSSGGIPITFAEGIPATYARPGRALVAWLTWIDQDYPQQQLTRLVHDGLLMIDDHADSVSFSSLATQLRSLPIGFGRDRYLPKITAQIEQHLQQQPAAARPSARADADLLDDSARRELQRQARARQLTRLQVLQDLTRDLLAISGPWPDAFQVLDSALTFLQRFSRSVTQLDQFASEKLINEITRLQNALKLSNGLATLDVRSWLRQLPRESHVMGSGPRPGAVHVAHILSGGHTGRPQTFVIGLDDSRFPAHVSQDPILLDRERARLQPDMPRAESVIREHLESFARTVQRLRGTLTLSYPCHDLVDDRELFPSSLMLSAYRTLCGNDNADPTDLRGLPTASFAADSPEKTLDDIDWWLHQFSRRERIRAAEKYVQQRHPHLANGYRAAEQRRQPVFTAFDGRVPAAGIDYANQSHLQKKPLSASALETLGQCPLRFFFRYRLHVYPLDEWVLDIERWLDPLAFGSLLHEVFRAYMQQLQQAGRKPVVERDKEVLGGILQHEIRRYRDDIPPPNEAAFRRQCRQLSRAAHVFLVSEAELCQANSPLYFEASIGLPIQQRQSDIDCAEPAMLQLANGAQLPIGGRIDRIDQLNPGEYQIWDYKTGSSWRFDANNPFQQGRTVQGTLYVHMAEEALQARHGQAKVVSFGYFFPGERDWGHRLMWSREQLLEGTKILEQFHQLLTAGSFLATDNSEDCSFCDYQHVCGDFYAVIDASNVKLDNDPGTALQAMKTLRQRTSG